MKKILDYEEMLEILANLNPEIIKKQEPIGYSVFDQPINHYTYGYGNEHIILTAGIHSAELITNVFLIRVMEMLSNKEFDFNPQKYTIHFIPIENPDGTIIVTSAVRSLIPRDYNAFQEQMICLQYYLNSRTDDNHVINHNDQENKLIHTMFKYVTPDCISDKYLKLKENVKKIIKENNLPKGCLINWTSNGNGIDLNANIEHGEILERFLSEKIKNANLRLNQINSFKPGPIGCPSKEKKYIEEPENAAVLNLYKKLIDEQKIIGSILYHSTGGYAYYLDFMDEVNYWNPNHGIREIKYNRNVAKTYAEIAQYKAETPATYTTFCAKIRSLLPGTLNVEISKLRSTPLSQFINFDINGFEEINNLKGEYAYLSKQYDILFKSNIEALIKTIETMSLEHVNYQYSVLVNKNNEYIPNKHFKIVDTNSKYASKRKLEETTFNQFKKFQLAAQKEGYVIEVESGYRNKEYQEKIWQEIVLEKGLEHTKKYVAVPGYSEHHTGLAIDICLFENGKYYCDHELKGHPVLDYLHTNAYKYGFILRYPENKESITGYNYEPWHFRYVGYDLAQKLYEENLTLEEYCLIKE